MKTLVFSDVHLKVPPDGEEVRRVFLRFLRGIDPTSVERLVVLGDLFDFWFEYRHVIFSGYFDVLRCFADLRDKGVRLYFVCGNHDLWAGRFLREQLGFEIARDRLVLSLGNHKAIFLHGDGVNPRDIGYRVYKRIATLPIVIGAFRLLHPDWAMGIARWVSHGSRTLFQPEDISKGPEVEPIRTLARTLIIEGEADWVFCGHSHYPVIETFPGPSGPGTYVNTGDWLYHRSYVEYSDGAVTLRYFDSTAPIEPVTSAETQETV